MPEPGIAQHRRPALERVVDGTRQACAVSRFDALSNQPFVQGVQFRQALLLAEDEASHGVALANACLNGIQFADPPQDLVRHGMTAYLRANDMEVDESDTCQKATELFRAGGYDVVVADYSLPDGTSLDLLPQFKRLSEDTPFIILTAHGSIELAVRAIKEGAEQFLTKPVESKTLLVLVRRLLQRQRPAHS